MEPCPGKDFQNCDPSPNLLNFSKTLSESPPNTVDETLVSCDFDKTSSPACDNNSCSIDDGNSDSEAETVLTDIPPFTCPNWYSPIKRYTHWSSPWTVTAEVYKPAASDLSFTAAAEHKFMEPDWTDDMPSPHDLPSTNALPLTDDMQIMPSVSPLLADDKRHYYVGAALKNLGNTCYINSVLQCFTHTVPLLCAILSFNHKSFCTDFYEGFCVLCALRQHIERSLCFDGKPVFPHKFADNLNYFSPYFKRFAQEDAHEFLQCFLDKLENRCNELIQKDMTTSGNNIVKEVFGGRLLSRLQCCNCGHYSNTYEPSVDLSLEIDDADSLGTALDSFTKLEKIEDPEIKFTCEKCKEQVFVQKQLLLDQVPPVAAFHLKRFKTDEFTVEKIVKHVDFPLKLDLQPYTAGGHCTNTDLLYDLYAILVHDGRSTWGHYYCIIRSASGQWFMCDDLTVEKVSEAYVLSQNAYILFYAKENVPCFSSFIETQKQYIDKVILNTSPKSVLDNVDPCISSSSVPLNGRVDVDETIGGLEEAFLETSSEPINNKAQDWEDKENKVPATVASAADADNTDLEPPGKAVDLSSKSTLRERNRNEGFVEAKDVAADATTKAPSRSPSPDIYKDDPPESTYSIPRDHLSSAERVSCKRQVNKDFENFEVEQARKLVKKNTPGLRGQQLIKAMRDHVKEGSQNKKRRPSMKDRNTNTRRGRVRGNIPLASGSSRLR